MLQHVAMQILIRVMGLSEWFTQYRTSFSLVRIDLNPSLTNSVFPITTVFKNLFLNCLGQLHSSSVYIYIYIYICIHFLITKRDAILKRCCDADVDSSDGFKTVIQCNTWK